MHRKLGRQITAPVTRQQLTPEKNKQKKLVHNLGSTRHV